MLRLAYRDVRLDARDLAREPRHFLQLPHGVEAAPILAISDDFEAVAAKLVDSVEVPGGSGVQVEHRYIPFAYPDRTPRSDERSTIFSVAPVARHAANNLT